MYGEVERCFVLGYWWGNMRDKDYLRDLVIDGIIILHWMYKK
jgi:hypothetical protein